MDERLKTKFNSRILFLYLLIIFSQQSFAFNYLAVVPSDKPYYNKTIKGIKAVLSPSDSLAVIKANDLTGLERYDGIISIGLHSAKKIIKQHYFTKQRVVFTLVPRLKINQLIHSYPSSLYSILVIDQPITRQLAIAQKWFPQIKTFSVILHADNAPLTDILNSVSVKKVTHYDNITRVIKQQFSSYDALIATANTNIYSRRNIRNIIVNAIKSKKPIIGFSKSLVKAGALFSAYTPPEEIGKESVTILLKGDTNKLYTPTRFKISLNHKIAKILLFPNIKTINLNRLYQDSELTHE